MPFLDLGSTPLADAFPKTADEDEAFYPLGLTVCQRCWLAQNTEVVPDDLLYNADYGFYTGASPSSLAYFKDYADWVLSRYDPQFVVEIASNDGTLLRHFLAPGRKVLGVEPAANVALAAKENGVPTHNRPFGRAVANDIGEDRADLIIANNVVAHVSDLDDFLGGIAILLAPDGTAIIEFQYVADLLLGNQFDHVYHEHRSFFSLSSLDAALRPHGLRIFDYEFTPAQGGSVRALVQRHSLVLHHPFEEWLSSPAAYGGVQGRIDHLRDRLQSLVIERSLVGPVAGYGATAKSTTLLNYCDIGNDIAYVADLTPSKIGRFTPGTRIPIVHPDDAPPADTYLLLAWNYLSGVLRRERAFLDRGGRFIVPIPAPVLL
jgi:SAM-dependent methyltransferase